MKLVPIHKGEELFRYIPQRPPFVLVDVLYEKGALHVVSGFTINKDNPLLERGLLTEGGLVENIAQTAALFAGVRFADQGLAVPIGYIAGIKDLEIKQLPAAGTSIYTRTTLTHDLVNIQVVEGEVFDEQDQLIARCELRIFIKGDE
ncbi:(3R)-hydroxymyristoyl-ACP dehydratase [Flammeovirgaceae bacterium 311]|nr:(3R)-hydroxymyristoyl-ACP dehydratase [Flammeovirgaceae bacterium 311]